MNKLLRQWRMLTNAYCPTGEGGGVDPTCPSTGGGAGGSSAGGALLAGIHDAASKSLSVADAGKGLDLMYKNIKDPALTYGKVDKFVNDHIAHLSTKDIKAALAGIKIDPGFGDPVRSITIPPHAAKTKDKLIKFAKSVIKDQIETHDRSFPVAAPFKRG